MQPEEQTEFLRAVGAFVCDQVKTATDPLLKRIGELEDQLRGFQSRALMEEDDVQVLIEGAQTARITNDKEELGLLAKCMVDEAIANLSVETVVEGIVQKAMQRAVADLPAPKDGKDVDPEEIVKRIIFTIDPNYTFTMGLSVYQELGELLKGKDADPVDYEMIGVTVNNIIKASLEDEIKKFSVVDGKDGKDGKDAVLDMDKVTEQILYAVEGHVTAEALGLRKFVEELPKPKDGKDGKDGLNGADGKSVSMDDLTDHISDLVVAAVGALPVPKHVVAGHIDRHGHLYHTYNDGSQLELGMVVGKDGTDGKDGAPGADGKDGAAGKDGKDGIGIPGKDGKDGVDGFKLEELTISFDGERGFIFKFDNGQGEVKEFVVTVPFPLYKGVWQAGEYKHGDCVTRSGGLWVALRDTDGMPNTADSGWQLCVKAGRDGKNGEPGPQGKEGKAGRDGRDLTQLGPDGSKWR